MWQFVKDNPFLVGAFTGSLAAYLLGLLVAHVKREKIWLGFSIVSRNIARRGHGRLSMHYDNREIQRLDSHTVWLRNIGNRALKNLPVAIESPNGEIVEHVVEAPDGAKFKTELLKGRLVVTCDLLNQGEFARVGLLVIDAEGKRPGVKVVARAENLRVKEIDNDALLLMMPATVQIVAKVARLLGMPFS
jgi:hypothetical protein